MSIKNPMLKFNAAAPTIQRGSHLDASFNSSARWQMLSAEVSVVTGAIIPISTAVERLLHPYSFSHCPKTWSREVLGPIASKTTSKDMYAIT